MNVIFFANDKFAVETIEKVSLSKHKVLLGITSNQNKRVRGLTLKENAITRVFKKNNINYIEIDNINNSSFINTLKDLNADIFIVIAYKILPKTIYKIPTFNTINLHASLLPKYKGAAPIQRALMNGETNLGVTTFFINDSIDSGRIINNKSVYVNDKITFTDASNLLSSHGAFLILDALDSIELESCNSLYTNVNINLNESYAKKISKDEYKINFNINSVNLHNKIRGLTKPGCYTYINNKRVKLFDTYYINTNEHSLNVGQFTLIDKKLHIGCKDSILTVEKVQLEGKNIIYAYEYFHHIKNITNDVDK